jgi:hypothetical protein
VLEDRPGDAKRTRERKKIDRVGRGKEKGRRIEAKGRRTRGGKGFRLA